MNLQENISRIKGMMGIIVEQVSTDLKSYLDELIKDPVAFVNKLKTDEEFKNAYGSSYKNADVDWNLLEKAKLQHIIKNKPVSGVIKNKETNQIVKDISVKSMDEYTQIVQNKAPNEIVIINPGKLYGTQNGEEVAYALNVPLQISQKNPNYIWFK
jgi:PDZ domain-containing secreted protein